MLGRFSFSIILFPYLFILYAYRTRPIHAKFFLPVSVLTATRLVTLLQKMKKKGWQTEECRRKIIMRFHYLNLRLIVIYFNLSILSCYDVVQLVRQDR